MQINISFIFFRLKPFDFDICGLLNEIIGISFDPCQFWMLADVNIVYLCKNFERHALIDVSFFLFSFFTSTIGYKFSCIGKDKFRQKEK